VRVGLVDLDAHMEHLEFPVLMAGKAAGRLKGDVHVRLPNDNCTKALVTVATAMGVTTGGIGLAEGRATEVIPGLLV